MDKLEQRESQLPFLQVSHFRRVSDLWGRALGEPHAIDKQGDRGRTLVLTGMFQVNLL